MDLDEIQDNRKVRIMPKGKKNKAVSIDKKVVLADNTVTPVKKVKKAKRKVSEKTLANLAKGRAKRKSNLAGKLQKLQDKVVIEPALKDRPIIVKEQERNEHVLVQKEEQQPKPEVAKPVIDTDKNVVDPRYVMSSDVDMFEEIYANKEFQMTANNGIILFRPATNEFPLSDAL